MHQKYICFSLLPSILNASTTFNLGKTQSKYGYANYRLTYLEKPPIPQILEDYYAGGEIRLVAKKTYGEEALRQLQTDPNVDEKTRKHFTDMPPEKREQIIGEAVARLWHLQQEIVAKSRAKSADPRS